MYSLSFLGEHLTDHVINEVDFDDDEDEEVKSKEYPKHVSVHTTNKSFQDFDYTTIPHRVGVVETTTKDEFDSNIPFYEGSTSSSVSTSPNYDGSTSRHDTPRYEGSTPGYETPKYDSSTPIHDISYGGSTPRHDFTYDSSTHRYDSSFNGNTQFTTPSTPAYERGHDENTKYENDKHVDTTRYELHDYSTQIPITYPNRIPTFNLSTSEVTREPKTTHYPIGIIPVTYPTHQGRCRADDKVRCGNTTIEICADQECDGNPDCPGGEDESYELCRIDEDDQDYETTTHFQQHGTYKIHHPFTNWLGVWWWVLI